MIAVRLAKVLVQVGVQKRVQVCVLIRVQVVVRIPRKMKVLIAARPVKVRVQAGVQLGVQVDVQIIVQVVVRILRKELKNRPIAGITAKQHVWVVAMVNAKVIAEVPVKKDARETAGKTANILA